MRMKDESVAETGHVKSAYSRNATLISVTGFWAIETSKPPQAAHINHYRYYKYTVIIQSISVVYQQYAIVPLAIDEKI